MVATSFCDFLRFSSFSPPMLVRSTLFSRSRNIDLMFLKSHRRFSTRVDELRFDDDVSSVIHDFDVTLSEFRDDFDVISSDIHDFVVTLSEFLVDLDVVVDELSVCFRRRKDGLTSLAASLTALSVVVAVAVVAAAAVAVDDKSGAIMVDGRADL